MSIVPFLRRAQSLSTIYSHLILELFAKLTRHMLGPTNPLTTMISSAVNAESLAEWEVAIWSCTIGCHQATAEQPFPAAVEPRRELIHALQSQGYFNSAVVVAQSLLMERTHRLGSHHYRTRQTQRMLADMHIKEGLLTEADKMLKATLGCSESDFACSHTSPTDGVAVECLCRLSYLSLLRGDSSGIAEYLEQAYHIVIHIAPAESTSDPQAVYHCEIANHYLNGSWRPKEGEVHKVSIKGFQTRREHLSDWLL